MLARQYDNYAWEEQQYEKQWYEEQLQAKEQDGRQAHMANRALQRNRKFIYVLLGMFMLTYLFTVIRSETLVQNGNQLLSLKMQETQLINKNNELKIEVERLKGPERIIGIAQKQLGMSVARNNIYVKAVDVKNTAAAYALANK